jgi:hypothetical protein
MLKVIQKGIATIPVGETSVTIPCPEMILPNACTVPPTDGDQVIVTQMNNDDLGGSFSIGCDMNDARFLIYGQWIEPHQYPCVVQYLVVREVPDMELTLRVKD